MVIRSIILFCLLCVNQNLQAQDSSIRQRKFSRSFFAIPSLGSSPETGFFGGASGTLDLAPLADSTARHSVLGAEITGTAKKQFILALRWDVTNHDYILFGENSWMKFPELYWGIGARTPDENELLYDAYRIEMENGLYRRMGKNLYAGLDQQLQAVYSMSIPDADKAPDVIRMQLNTGIASGFGIGVLFDSRSNLLNPRAGEYLMMLHGLYFSKWFGSDYGFPHAHTDFRCYLPAGGKNILALQTTAEFFGDGAPFRLQAMLGGSMMMRGLYQGRYRDQNQITAQAEYRMVCWKWIGAAAFAAAGNVFSIKHPERNGSIRTSAGLGLRFRVDKRENTNIRLDYGWVNDGSRGFYLSFGEAF